MKTFLSFLSSRTAVLAISLIVLAIAAHFGHGQSALPLVMVGSMLTDEPVVRFLTALGLMSPAGYLQPVQRIVAKTADYTVLVTDACGTLFTTRGAAGAVNFTLPLTGNGLPAGWWVEFLNLVDQNMTITGGVADTLIADGDLTSDSVAASTASHKIGARVKVTWDGTAFIANGVSVGATYTVAT